VLEPWVHRVKKKGFLFSESPERPQLLVENSNLTTTSILPALALLNLRAWRLSKATSVPGKRGVRAVSVAHGTLALGLSSRQVSPKTQVSSHYHVRKITAAVADIL
jgi:hypothetical protein